MQSVSQMLKRSVPKAVSGAFLLTLFTAVIFGVTQVRAAGLSSISDTMTRMKASTLSSHTISFTLDGSTALDAGETITIDFDEDGGEFTVDGASDAIADYDFNDGTERTVISVDGTCTAGSDNVDLTLNDTTGVLTVTACGSYTSSSTGATVTIEIGTAAGGTNRITNPSSAATYVVDIAGTVGDTGSFAVDILSDDQVAVTADVQPTFDFNVAAKTSGTVNGEATSCLASGVTATAIAYGTMTAGTPKVACQTLTVTTNASNGFIVTVEQDQNLTNAASDDIDAFKDGTAQTTPAAWTAPAGTLGTEDTYGHFGFTSEDSDLNGDEFGSALYAGLSGTTTDQIFGHTGPADGSTADKGSTNVAYKVETNALQEAGDYSSTLTYIATGTF